MKKIVLALIALGILLLSTSAFAGDIPDMKGTWVCGTVTVGTANRGIWDNPQAQSALVITEQKGRIFSGHKDWVVKGETMTEKIVGGVAMDGEIYISEAKDGQLLGDLEGDTMYLIYVESGDDAKVIELEYKKAK